MAIFLEVSNFDQAVAFSAQTALRDAIGKHELGEMLSQRDKLGREIQKVLEAKTNSWGITVQSVEIKDIIIQISMLEVRCLTFIS